MRCSIFFLTLLTCLAILYIIQELSINKAHGQSGPAFPIQQIPDKIKDWSEISTDLFDQHNSKQIDPKQCIKAPLKPNLTAACAPIQDCVEALIIPTSSTNKNLPFRTMLPDISGVSYVNDGKVLKGTIWLSEPLPDYLLNSQYYKKEIVKFSKQEQIKSFLTSHNVPINANSNKQQQELLHLAPNKTTTMTYNYTSKEENQKREGIIKFSKRNSTEWDVIMYDAPVWLKSANSIFHILNQTNNYGKLTQESFFRANDLVNIFSSSQIPWIYSDMTQSDHHPSYIFYPNPFWENIDFEVYINIPSFYDSPADYRYLISWNVDSKNWTGILEEISPNSSSQLNSNKIIASNAYPVHLGANRTYFDFAVNLSEIDMPKTYEVLSAVSSLFTINTRNGSDECHFRDITNFVELPPPRISLYAIPSSLNMKPGDHKVLELRANSSTNLPTMISLKPLQPPGMNLTLSSSEIDIPPLGTSSSTLHVKANDDILNNAKNASYDRPIVVSGIASFPIKISEFGSNKLYQNAYEKTRLSAYAHATIQNPTPIQDQIYDIFHTSASTLSDFQGVITTLAGIITSLGIFFGWLFRRKRHGGGHREQTLDGYLEGNDTEENKKRYKS
jgi:hypothetical protein